MLNATNYIKDLEGSVGQNSSSALQQMVASSTGADRLTITFVVPFGWFYQINVNYHTGSTNTVGLGPGETFLGTAWWTY